MQAGIIEEMLEDTFEGVEEDDLEEAAQEEVEKVLFEVTKGTVKLQLRVVFFAFESCSWIVSFLSASAAVGKGKGAHETKSLMNRVYLGFFSMKHALGVILLLPLALDRILPVVHHRVTPLGLCHWFPFIHLGEERD